MHPEKSELQHAAEWLVNEAERGARFIRRQTPESLRAWANRMEIYPAMRGDGRHGSCLPASSLEAAASAVRSELHAL